MQSRFGQTLPLRTWKTLICEAGDAEGAGLRVTEDGSQAGKTSSETGHLPDEAIVIRGGVMKVGDLRVSAEKYEARYPGHYALSFWSWVGLTTAEIAQKVGDKLPHPVLRESTALRIRSQILSDKNPATLVKTGDPGHYTLPLPSPLNDDDLALIGQTFDPPKPNPVARPRGRNA